MLYYSNKQDGMRKMHEFTHMDTCTQAKQEVS